MANRHAAESPSGSPRSVVVSGEISEIWDECLFYLSDGDPVADGAVVLVDGAARTTSRICSEGDRVVVTGEVILFDGASSNTSLVDLAPDVEELISDGRTIIVARDIRRVTEADFPPTQTS